MVPRALIGLSLLSIASVAFARSDVRSEFTQLLMGVQARVVVYAPDTEAAQAGARVAFQRIAALEMVMSDYQSESELSRVNAGAGKVAVPVGEDLWKALDLSRETSARTRGAFDPTVGPLVQLWRGARRTGVLPSSEEVAAARELVGMGRVRFDSVGHTVMLTRAGMALDLGGIGKGIAAQAGVEALRKAGLPRCMVALSGDIAVGDAPPGSKGWRLALDTGYASGRGTIEVENASVSTAGDANQFVEVDGVRYSHIIDPETGLGSTRGGAAIVVARDGGVADGLDTALAVLGIERGREVLAAFPGVSAVMFERAAHEVKRFESAGFPRIEGGAAMYDPKNEPPAGFTALFNGRDLSNWQGLVDGPPAVRAMTPEARAKAQGAADERMRAHWSVKDGVLVFDGKGDSLQSARDFKDFELYVDWMIDGGGDSGIYLRGSPQVQIWDNPIGSGGLYNNQKNISRPLAFADHKPDQWNRFHILMRGERVTVYLNGVLVVDDVPLENYWERDRTIYPTGPIELQNHGSVLKFRNIFVRELSAATQPAERDERMAWWREARFGMFIHWGLYAIPAGEWNGKVYNSASEWLMNTAKIPPAEYEKLAPKFNPVKFDAAAWAAIARDAGMKYVVITTKHHDGFCLFDSAQTGYDVMDATPFKRDIMKELSGAVRDAGLKMCWYHSIMDWHQPDANKERWPQYAPVLRKQVEEVLTKYGPIGVMWFDGEWVDEWTTEQGRELYDLCRRLQPSVIVNNRVGKGRQGMQGMTKEGDHPGDFGTPEQEVPRRGVPGVDWETCMTMNDSWGFHRTDLNWKSSRQLIRMLAETASKGGNFLLNVGPTELGEIPAASVERLRAIGAWMQANSPSIYDTVSGPFERLPWGRCTMKESPLGSTLFLHVFEWPTEGQLVVPGLLNEVRRCYLLADPKRAFAVEQSPLGVIIRVPTQAPNADDAVIVVEVAGEAAAVPSIIGQAADGSLLLDSLDADIHGDSPKYEADEAHRCIGFWSGEKDSVSWDFVVTRAGRFRVELEYGCENAQAGSVVTLSVGKAELMFNVNGTGKWTDFKVVDAGSMDLATGRATLKVVPKSKAGQAVMNLRTVRLVPVK